MQIISFDIQVKVTLMLVDLTDRCRTTSRNVGRVKFVGSGRNPFESHHRYEPRR